MLNEESGARIQLAAKGEAAGACHHMPLLGLFSLVLFSDS